MYQTRSFERSSNTFPVHYISELLASISSLTRFPPNIILREKRKENHQSQNHQSQFTFCNGLHQIRHQYSRLSSIRHTYAELQKGRVICDEFASNIFCT